MPVIFTERARGSRDFSSAPESSRTDSKRPSKSSPAVDAVQVQTCGEIGLVVVFEQGGLHRAEYGSRLLQILASSLAEEFGRGFDTSLYAAVLSSFSKT